MSQSPAPHNPPLAALASLLGLTLLALTLGAGTLEAQTR